MTLWGLVGMMICCGAYAVIATVDSPGNIGAKIFLIIWPIPFSVSLGGLVLLYIGEILPSAGVSIATVFIWLLGFAGT